MKDIFSNSIKMGVYTPDQDQDQLYFIKSITTVLTYFEMQLTIICDFCNFYKTISRPVPFGLKLLRQGRFK